MYIYIYIYIHIYTQGKLNRQTARLTWALWRNHASAQSTSQDHRNQWGHATSQSQSYMMYCIILYYFTLLSYYTRLGPTHCQLTCFCLAPFSRMLMQVYVTVDSLRSGNIYICVYMYIYIYIYRHICFGRPARPPAGSFLK